VEKQQPGGSVIITTTDPITGEEIRNPQFKPFVIEGGGHLAIKIYFESEETRRQYLDIAGGESTAGSYRAKIARSRNSRNLPGHTGIPTCLLHPLDAEDGSLTESLS
jgi:hypothetical protein